jgi:hypothetical protein
MYICVLGLQEAPAFANAYIPNQSRRDLSPPTPPNPFTNPSPNRQYSAPEGKHPVCWRENTHYLVVVRKVAPDDSRIVISIEPHIFFLLPEVYGRAAASERNQPLDTALHSPSVGQVGLPARASPPPKEA